MATKLAAETFYRARTILSCEHAQTAVANEPAMRAGQHFVEFTFDPIMATTVNVGIVTEGFPAGSGVAAYSTPDAFMFSVGTGYLLRAGMRSARRRWTQSFRAEDRIGLLLDLEADSLSLFQNGEWRGVMVESGLGKSKWRWAADLVGRGTSVQIEAKAPPTLEQ